MTMADDAESTGEEIRSTAVRYALVAAISREGSTPRRLTIRTGLQCGWARILGFRICRMRNWHGMRSACLAGPLLQNIIPDRPAPVMNEFRACDERRTYIPNRWEMGKFVTALCEVP